MNNRNIFLVSTVIIAFFNACDSDEQMAEYKLDEETSVVEWHGAGLAAQHTGAFKVEQESLSVVDEKITQGSFTISISSITNFDLPDEVKPILLGHLMTADFFNVAAYPTASFVITAIAPYSGVSEDAIENANFYIKGDFAMIGRTNPVEFPAKIIFKDNVFTIEAVITIDRTKWGMDYMSDEAAAGEHYIYKEVDLHLKLVGKRN